MFFWFHAPFSLCIVTCCIHPLLFLPHLLTGAPVSSFFTVLIATRKIQCDYDLIPNFLCSLTSWWPSTSICLFSNTITFTVTTVTLAVPYMASVSEPWLKVGLSLPYSAWPTLIFPSQPDSA